MATNGASLPGEDARRYFGAASAGAFNHFLIVLRDRLVRLAISLIDLPSRWYSARILPFKAMVITVRNPCHKLQQGRSFTPVSFQSALPGFAGQFSVGDNSHGLPIAPNLLARDFSPATPDAVWTSDITYVATDEGWLYLAAIIDLFSRQVVGWSIKPHMRQDLVSDALRMAWFRRRPAPGLIMHSDRGSQYCAKEFTGALESYGMRPSMSRKGDCWDNAPTESLWGSLKVGRLHGKRFATRRAAMDEIVDWLSFYNVGADRIVTTRAD